MDVAGGKFVDAIEDADIANYEGRHFVSGNKRLVIGLIADR